MVFDMPMFGQAARKAGHTMACTADAHRLLAAGELTAVFPEGYKGLGKPFKDRYKLQRFGRGGFVSAALRAKAPIVPCSIVGSEEIYPMIADVKLLARLLGVPYFPITPLFPLAGPVGLVPLPSKWHIQFGEPISTADYDEAAPDDPMVTFELTDQVRETIQQTLYQLLANRRNTFFG
jgi:1-acyl-sn-glycerol-3-phosphate acyltransferase